MKTLFLLTCLLPFGLLAQSEAQSKVCKIISFRVEASRQGIEDSILLNPLKNELSRVFRFTEISLVPGLTIDWSEEDSFNRVKKLTKMELKQFTGNIGELLLKVEVEHRLKALLVGILGKSKHHILRLKIVMFTDTGERMWYHKIKDSCCIELGFGSEDEDEPDNQMEPSSFLNFYEKLLNKAFAKL
jgi:hypothetical protein